MVEIICMSIGAGCVVSISCIISYLINRKRNKRMLGALYKINNMSDGDLIKFRRGKISIDGAK